MNHNIVNSKLLQFAKRPNRMSRRALKAMTLKWNRPFKIWGETLEGDKYEGRELFSFTGPSNNPGVGYDYEARGYMIFYDMNKGDYRTFVYDLITAFEQDGVKYEIV